MIRPFRPSRVEVDADVAETELAARALAIGPPSSALAESTVLRIRRKQGAFVKRCPCTPTYLGCGYVVLHVAEGCDLGCSYCVLRGYFSGREVTLFANTSDLFAQVDRLLEVARVPLRVGTGEFTDSLRFDGLLQVNAPLIERFARSASFLELKSKSDEIGGLEGLAHGGRTVLAWSVAPDGIAASHESMAASLDDRLRAARACQEWGYPLAFHLDPLLDIEGWRDAYDDLISRLTRAVTPDRVAWVSLGALRYPRGFAREIIDAHRRRLFLGETVRGLDDKVRYFKPLRVDLFRHLASRLQAWRERGVGLYLCMEPPDVWEAVLGWRPKNTRAIREHVLRASLRLR